MSVEYSAYPEQFADVFVDQRVAARRWSNRHNRPSHCAGPSSGLIIIGHADVLLTLGVGADQGVVNVDDRLGEEGRGLLRPDPSSGLIDCVHQGDGIASKRTGDRSRHSVVGLGKVEVAGIALAFQIPQVVSPHATYDEQGCQWLHYVCPEVSLSELVAAWHGLAPEVREKIRELVRTSRL